MEEATSSKRFEKSTGGVEVGTVDGEDSRVLGAERP